MPRGHRRGGMKAYRRPFSVSELNWLNCRIRLVTIYQIKGARRFTQGRHYEVTPTMSLEEKQKRDWAIVEELYGEAGVQLQRPPT